MNILGDLDSVGHTFIPKVIPCSKAIRVDIDFKVDKMNVVQRFAAIGSDQTLNSFIVTHDTMKTKDVSRPYCCTSQTVENG